MSGSLTFEGGLVWIGVGDFEGVGGRAVEAGTGGVPACVVGMGFGGVLLQVGDGDGSDEHDRCVGSADGRGARSRRHVALG